MMIPSWMPAIYHESPEAPIVRTAYQWVRNSDGQMRWGPEGAAGILFHHPRTNTYLLTHRSPEVHMGDTWGIPGGAIDPGESPYQAALRESQEELGQVPQHTVTGIHEAAPVPDWKYHTVMANVPEQFEPEYADSWETQGHGWFTPEEIAQLPLHPGFASAWNSGVLGPRTSMAMDPSFLNRYIQEYGPYMYHGAHPRLGGDPEQIAQKIEQEGIVPQGDERPDEGYPGYKPYNENEDHDNRALNWWLNPRPGHVYLGATPDDAYGNPLFRIDLRKLDPTKLKADEDYLREHGTPEFGPYSDPSIEGTPRTLGQQAEEIKWGDNPEDTAKGLMNEGTLAHEGPIPPEVIERYDSKISRMAMANGFFYHTAPAKYRQQIEEQGLLPTSESPVSPWAHKTGPEREQQPHGVYMWDNPENAKAYAYNIEGRKGAYPGDREEEGFDDDVFESPEYYEHMEKFKGEPHTDEYYDHESEFEPPRKPLYDVWKVNTLGYEPQIDPEMAIHHGELTAEEAQQQINEEGWQNRQYSPDNPVEKQEGHRWYVPHAIEPARLTLHHTIYPEDMTERNWEDLSDNQKEVPNAWHQVPLNEWNEKAQKRYLGDPNLMREIDPRDRTR